MVITRRTVRLTPIEASKWSPKKVVECPIALARMVGRAVVITNPMRLRPKMNSTLIILSLS